jgi:hypothetical protein
MLLVIQFFHFFYSSLKLLVIRNIEINLKIEMNARKMKLIQNYLKRML